MTIFGKTDHLRAFCTSRNTDLKYLMHCVSPVAQYSHARYLVCIVWLYNYHFIANSTSYLTAAGFSDGFFSAPVISRIESIGGGWVGGGWGGWVGS